MTAKKGTAMVLEDGTILVMEQISALVPSQRVNMSPVAYFSGGGFNSLTDSEYERIREWILDRMTMLS